MLPSGAPDSIARCAGAPDEVGRQHWQDAAAGEELGGRCRMIRSRRCRRHPRRRQQVCCGLRLDTLDGNSGAAYEWNAKLWLR